MQKNLFNFREFEFIHGVFSLPDNVYIFRSVNPNIPVNPSYPAFFGDYEVAKFYAPGRILKVYEQKQGIKVIDIRYVQAILPLLFNAIRPSQSDVDVIKFTSLALGLVSYQKQIEMLEALNQPILQPMIQRMRDFAALPNKPSWVNPIEMRGVRCGITNVDYFVTGFLKELFSDIIDGIIAPALPSPYHDQIDVDVAKSMMYQELILFNPEKSLKEYRSSSERLTYNQIITAQHFVNNMMRVATPATSVTSQRTLMMPQAGGHSETPPREPRDATAEKIAAGDIKLKRTFTQFMKKARKLATKIKRTQLYLKYYCPNICVVGSPIGGSIRIGYWED